MNKMETKLFFTSLPKKTFKDIHSLLSASLSFVRSSTDRFYENGRTDRELHRSLRDAMHFVLIWPNLEINGNSREADKKNMNKKKRVKAPSNQGYAAVQCSLYSLMLICNMNAFAFILQPILTTTTT